MAQFLYHLFEPSAVAAGFHANHYPLALQPFVEPPRFSRLMLQLAFPVLARSCIHHGDALKTRMKITANPYNVHDGSFLSESWSLQTQVYSAPNGSRCCYEIKPRGEGPPMEMGTTHG